MCLCLLKFYKNQFLCTCIIVNDSNNTTQLLKMGLQNTTRYNKMHGFRPFAILFLPSNCNKRSQTRNILCRTVQYYNGIHKIGCTCSVMRYRVSKKVLSSIFGSIDKSVKSDFCQTCIWVYNFQSLTIVFYLGMSYEQKMIVT